MTTPELRLWVSGTPAAQGSKRHVGNGVMVESSRAVGPWREAIRAETQRALADGGTSFPAGPVGVHATFWFRRPTSHYGTGRNAQTLKPDAPRYVARTPDIDKIQRALLDGLTAGGAWADDKQVALVLAEKYWVGNNGGTPGVEVRVWGLS